MLNAITRNRVIGYWFVVVAVMIAIAVLTGVKVGPSTTAILVDLSLVPPGIVLVLWRSGPPPTIGEVLYTVNTRTEGRS